MFFLENWNDTILFPCPLQNYNCSKWWNLSGPVKNKAFCIIGHRFLVPDSSAYINFKYLWFFDGTVQVVFDFVYDFSECSSMPNMLRSWILIMSLSSLFPLSFLGTKQKVHSIFRSLLVVIIFGMSSRSQGWSQQERVGARMVPKYLGSNQILKYVRRCAN